MVQCEHHDSAHGSLQQPQLRFMLIATCLLPQDIPQQQNGSDCGVFALRYCEALAREGELEFEQADMPDLRMRIAVDIMQLRVG